MNTVLAFCNRQAGRCKCDTIQEFYSNWWKVNNNKIALGHLGISFCWPMALYVTRLEMLNDKWAIARNRWASV